MRLIAIEDYNQSTMQLAKPVFDEHRRILLGAGNSIHPKLLKRIQQLGISHLVIEDKKSQGITLDEMVDMPTWMDAIRGVKEAFEQVEKEQSLSSLPSIQKIAGTLIEEVAQRKAIMLVPSTSNGSDLQSYAHAVNVTLLALQIGKRMGYNELELRDLALGCLLHDIGKAVTKEELEHPKEGFKILKEVRELNLKAAHIALQHHETLDGNGYPRGLAGSDILGFAQICSVANDYENLISLEEVPPHEAMERIMAQNEILYPSAVVEAFLKGVPAYPPGTTVRLSNGEEAIVTQIDAHMQRPTVRVLSSQEEIALADHPTMMITELVEEKDKAGA